MTLSCCHTSYFGRPTAIFRDTYSTSSSTHRVILVILRPECVTILKLLTVSFSISDSSNLMCPRRRMCEPLNVELPVSTAYDHTMSVTRYLTSVSGLPVAGIHSRFFHVLRRITGDGGARRSLLPSSPCRPPGLQNFKKQWLSLV